MVTKSYVGANQGIKLFIMKRLLPILISLMTLATIMSCDYNVNKTKYDRRPKILKQPNGKWLGKGEIVEKPIEYSITIEPVLNNTFSKIHLLDVNKPPQYEAHIYIGVDSLTNVVYAHWLNSFGAAYSIPHVTGIINESSIEFVIPYPESPFKDIFTYDAMSHSWKLLIESYSNDTKA
jgi:hypothetical protein